MTVLDSLLKMTDKEFESIKKKSIVVQEFSHTTKTNVISSEINQLLVQIKRKLTQKKNVTVLVVETDK
jgi:hypothetical protein